MNHWEADSAGHPPACTCVDCVNRKNEAVLPAARHLPNCRCATCKQERFLASRASSPSTTLKAPPHLGRVSPIKRKGWLHTTFSCPQCGQKLDLDSDKSGFCYWHKEYVGCAYQFFTETKL